MGLNLGHGFRGGAGRLHGSHGVTKAGEWVLKVFWLYSKREKQWTGSVSAACFSPGRHRPSASARAFRAASILTTNSLVHRIASSTSWSTGRPSARAAYIFSSTANVAVSAPSLPNPFACRQRHPPGASPRPILAVWRVGGCLLWPVGGFAGASSHGTIALETGFGACGAGGGAACDLRCERE